MSDKDNASKDPLLGPAHYERENDYVSPEDYPADEKITPPAVQTNAKLAPVVGEPVDGTDPATEQVKTKSTDAGDKAVKPK